MDLRMKKFFLYLSIAILLLGIPVTVFLVSRNQELRKRAAPASTLSITPATVTAKKGETFSLDIKIDPATNQVGTIQIFVEYDPTKLKGEDITNGAMAPSILASGKIDPAGIASIKVGAKSNAEPITEFGTVAVLTMTVLETSTTPLTVKFTPPPKTYANALDEAQNNVLVAMTPATITTLNADGTSAASDTQNDINLNTTITPMATPTATLASTPTATPSATRTLTLTPTPTLISNQTASSSALTITSISPNENIEDDTPTFSGKVQPGYSITLTIYSEPRTVVVTVDANGNWTYTPQEGLEPGPHTVVALATDPTTGQTQTATIPFVVNGSQNATDSAVPVAGSIQTTIIFLSFAILLLLIGTGIPLLIR